jgi:hypothetical protein
MEHNFCYCRSKLYSMHLYVQLQAQNTPHRKNRKSIFKFETGILKRLENELEITVSQTHSI